MFISTRLRSSTDSSPNDTTDTPAPACTSWLTSAAASAADVAAWICLASATIWSARCTLLRAAAATWSACMTTFLDAPGALAASSMWVAMPWAARPASSPNR